MWCGDDPDLPMHTIKFCSVVFSLTLRLLVINTLSSSPANNKWHHLPAMSVTNLPRSGTAVVCITLGSRTVDNTWWTRYWSRIVLFAYLICIWCPCYWGPHKNIVIMFSMEKPEWCGYPTVKKILKICLLISTEYMNVTDEWTNRQTDRHLTTTA